jgi:ribosomal protein S18 acetylase RimI-like enzyme
VRVEVRAATLDDVEGMVAVAVQAWEEGFRGIVPAEIDAREAWAPDRLRTRLRDDRVARAVAEVEGRIVGFVTFGASRDRDAGRRTGEIWALNVHPDLWRHGVGRALVRHALAELRRLRYREVSLWTLADSDRARAFYAACGFRHDGAEQRRRALGGPLEVRYRLALPPRRPQFAAKVLKKC